MIKNNIFSILFLIATFILVTYIAYLSPMQSDDFSYHNMGLHWQTHVNHYNTWSGRFLADYISPLLLMSSKIISSSIIGFAAVGMVFIISILPSLVLKQAYSTKSFIILFLIYWLANPTLGQTTFWVVGAANYLFANLIVVIYLLLFILYTQNPNSTARYLLLLLVSSFVGFSSENTTWIVLLFSLASSAYLFKKQNDSKILFSLILVGCSFYLMIFSPGNMVRANSESFEGFYDVNFLERVWNFIIYRVPTAFVRLLPIFVPMLFLFVIAIQNKLPKSQKNTCYIFCIIALLSLGSMVMSPTLTYRSLSGPFLFLLFACGVLLQFIFSQSLFYLQRLSKILYAALTVIFIISYTLIAHSYYRLSLQEKIILTEIQSYPDQVVILPEYYYTPSLRDRDSHDQYINISAMSQFYKIKDIQLVKVYFDFSQIHSKMIPTIKNDIFAQISLSPLGLFGAQGTNIVLESNDIFNFPNKKLTIKISTKQNSTQTISIPLESITLNQQNLIGLTSKYKMHEVKKIQYAISSKEQEPENFKLIYTTN